MYVSPNSSKTNCSPSYAALVSPPASSLPLVLASAPSVLPARALGAGGEWQRLALPYAVSCGLVARLCAVHESWAGSLSRGFSWNQGLRQVIAGRSGSYGMSSIALSCCSDVRRVPRGLVPALQKNEIGLEREG